MEWRDDGVRKMKKTEKEIIEEIMKRYERGEIDYIESVIAEGIKAGRKQLTEELLQNLERLIEFVIDECDTLQFVGADILAQIEIIKEKLEKEVEK